VHIGEVYELNIFERVFLGVSISRCAMVSHQYIVIKHKAALSLVSPTTTILEPQRINLIIEAYTEGCNAQGIPYNLNNVLSDISVSYHEDRA
jgi:hypothetical protein